MSNQNTTNTTVFEGRNAIFDYARVIGAFFVIYGHLYTPNPDNFVRVFIYQFHMAFFFVVSGMLHKYNGTIQLRKYAKGILLPVLTFVGIYYIMSGFLYHIGWFGYKEAIPNTVVGHTVFETFWNYLLFSIRGVKTGTSMLNGPCWFLISLFYCKIILDSVEKRKDIGIGVIVLILFCILHHNKYLFLSNAMMAMPFYYFGYKMKWCVKYLSTLNKVHKVCLFVLFAILVLSIMHVNGTVSMWSLKYGNHGRMLSVPLFYIVGISGSAMMLVVSSFFNKSRTLVTFMANSLITIVGIQVPCIFVIDNCIGYDLSYFASAGIATLIMGICIVCHFFITKYCPTLIGKK